MPTPRILLRRSCASSPAIRSAFGGPPSRHDQSLVPRTKTADKVVRSARPYCAVGRGQKVYVKERA